VTGSSLQTVPDVRARDAGIRLKFLSTKIGSGKTPRGGADAYVENGVLFIRSQNVHPGGLRLDDIVRISLDVDAEMYGTRVKPGDVLLNITGASIGRAAPVPFGLEAANVNQHVCIIRSNPKYLLYHFLHYALVSQIIQSQIFTAENGISREGLNFEQVGDLLIPSPGSLRQQQGIVAFLDRETAKIDALIAKQTEFLTRLDDHRRALITEAVTTGLDLSVPLWETGIQYLPATPTHWRVMSVRRVAARIQTGTTPPTAERRYYEDGIVPWFGPGSFGEGIDPRQSGAANLFCGYPRWGCTSLSGSGNCDHYHRRDYRKGRPASYDRFYEPADHGGAI
jgi:type I restriction enzyme S subunit